MTYQFLTSAHLTLNKLLAKIGFDWNHHRPPTNRYRWQPNDQHGHWFSRRQFAFADHQNECKNDRT